MQRHSHSESGFQIPRNSFVSSTKTSERALLRRDGNYSLSDKNIGLVRNEVLADIRSGTGIIVARFHCLNVAMCVSAAPMSQSCHCAKLGCFKESLVSLFFDSVDSPDERGIGYGLCAQRLE
jgi:hypothetical protein